MRVSKTVYYGGFKFAEGSELKDDHKYYDEVKKLLVETVEETVTADKSCKRCAEYGATLISLQEENAALNASNIELLALLQEHTTPKPEVKEAVE